MPEGILLIWHAYDIDASMKPLLSRMNHRVDSWIGGYGFELATAKTELALLTENRIPIIRTMLIAEVVVQTKAVASYLSCRATRRKWPVTEVSSCAHQRAVMINIIETSH